MIALSRARSYVICGMLINYVRTDNNYIQHDKETCWYGMLILFFPSLSSFPQYIRISRLSNPAQCPEFS